MTNNARHILSLSGGKDSTALAVYMRDRVPEMEYVFCDTGKELTETYDYLQKVEAYLGRKIVVLNSAVGFDHWLELYGGYLPSPQARWCTRMLKIIPFEQYVGDDTVYSYIGIRADEDRQGYISSKPNIKPVYPFKEDGVTHDDVFRILDQCGLGVPDYYKWRSRSGCYFCFFQRRIEWVGLMRTHPDLFEKAKRYEKYDPETKRLYTWSQNETLEQLAERADEVLASSDASRAKPGPPETLFDIYNDAGEDETDRACIVCDL